MKHEIGAEIQKGRRRHDMLLALLMGLIAVGWATQSKPRMEDELASGYSALLYALPLMNTIIMPICMAVLASRLWDMEAKSGSLKLLFTLQSRGSLFAGKVLVGMAQNALICAVEGAGLLVLGRLQGFTQAVPADHLAWLLLCTYLVNAMLFLRSLGYAGAGAWHGRGFQPDRRIRCVHAAGFVLFYAMGLLHAAGFRAHALGQRNAHLYF